MKTQATAPGMYCDGKDSSKQGKSILDYNKKETGLFRSSARQHLKAASVMLRHVLRTPSVAKSCWPSLPSQIDVHVRFEFGHVKTSRVGPLGPTHLRPGRVPGLSSYL